MSRRPILLFDVMETLVSDPFFTALPALFGLTRDELRQAVHPTSWIEFEEGRIDEASYLARFFRDERAVDVERVRTCVRGAYRWLDGMEALVRDLHQGGYELHTLSNYSSWFELIEEATGLSRYVRWTFVSCLTGLRKPAPAAYLNAAKQRNVTPGDCLFIDDRTVNVAAARQVGMDAILKTDAASLRRELEQRGLL